jgi:hypothetical protein
MRRSKAGKRHISEAELTVSQKSLEIYKNRLTGFGIHASIPTS